MIKNIINYAYRVIIDLSYREAPTYTISFLFRRILVPIDGSENSLKALDIAVDLAKYYGSTVDALFVKPKGSTLSIDPVEKAMRRVEKKPIKVNFRVVEYDPLSESASSKIISEVIEGNYDLIVMGARGLNISSEISIGSTALSVVSSAPVTVMVIK
ncbi:MAG: universal stress protein [Desulfurococcaceae archaeon]